jgi:predicted PurR-regulated permease PerM
LLGLFIGPILVSLLMTAVQIYREEYYLKHLEVSANPPAPS